MQLIDLQGYERYLRDRRLVPEVRLPYYLSWVRRFLQGPGADRHLSPKDQVEVFRDMLQGNQSIQDWQVTQAVHAVELYLKNFLPSQPPDSASPASGLGSESALKSLPTTPPDALIAMQELRFQACRCLSLAGRGHAGAAAWLQAVPSRLPRLL